MLFESTPRPMLRHRWASPVSTYFPWAVYPGLWKGCIGAWCPNLGISGPILDYSGYGHVGSREGSIQFAENGKAGYCLDFDGSDDYVNLGPIPESEGLDVISISAWAKIGESNPGNSMIIATTDTTPDVAQFFWDGNDIRSRIDAGGTNTLINGPDKSAFEYDEWFHFATSYDGTRHRVYFNGLFHDGQDITGTLDVDSGKDWQIGAKDGAVLWPGQIDDVRMYNRTLSVEEIWILSGFGGNEEIGRAISYRVKQQAGSLLPAAAPPAGAPDQIMTALQGHGRINPMIPKDLILSY